jgi:hypothetical protein
MARRWRHGQRSVAGEEAGFLHQLLVALFFLLDPGGVFGAGHESLVESAVMHELLPLRRLTHLLEQIDIVVGLLLGDARRHEDAAQHHVFDVDALALAGRDVAPRHVAGDLVLDRQRLRVEHAQRPDLAGAPLRHRLDGIVDGGVDMAADELHGDFAAALVGDVGQLLAGGLFQRHGDDLVFLLGAGATHLELARLPALDGSEIVLGLLVRRVGIDPQHELVERQHGDRRELLPVERNAGGKRRREQVGQSDDDLVRISARGFDVEKTLAAGAARLVDDDHGSRHQIVLGDDALDDPGHLVGAAAGTGRNDELDRTIGLPGSVGNPSKRPGDSGQTHNEHARRA